MLLVKLTIYISELHFMVYGSLSGPPMESFCRVEGGCVNSERCLGH